MNSSRPIRLELRPSRVLEVIVLEALMIGKKIVGVSINPTEASFTSYRTGSLSLTMESGEVVTFELGCGPTYHTLVIYVDGKEVATT